VRSLSRPHPTCLDLKGVKLQEPEAWRLLAVQAFVMAVFGSNNRTGLKSQELCKEWNGETLNEISALVLTATLRLDN
jgi:hypothetical protein